MVNTTVFGAVVPSSNLGEATNDAPVAQRIEQQFSKLWDGGLNPPWCTNCGMEQWLAFESHNLNVGGSNPPPATLM